MNPKSTNVKRYGTLQRLLLRRESVVRSLIFTLCVTFAGTFTDSIHADHYIIFSCVADEHWADSNDENITLQFYDAYGMQMPFLSSDDEFRIEVQKNEKGKPEHGLDWDNKLWNSNGSGNYNPFEKSRGFGWIDVCSVELKGSQDVKYIRVGCPNDNILLEGVVIYRVTLKDGKAMPTNMEVKKKIAQDRKKLHSLRGLERLKSTADETVYTALKEHVTFHGKSTFEPIRGPLDPGDSDWIGGTTHGKFKTFVDVDFKKLIKKENSVETKNYSVVDFRILRLEHNMSLTNTKEIGSLNRFSTSQTSNIGFTQDFGLEINQTAGSKNLNFAETEIRASANFGFSQSVSSTKSADLEEYESTVVEQAFKGPEPGTVTIGFLRIEKDAEQQKMGQFVFNVFDNVQTDFTAFDFIKVKDETESEGLKRVAHNKNVLSTLHAVLTAFSNRQDKVVPKYVQDRLKDEYSNLVAKLAKEDVITELDENDPLKKLSK